MPDICLECPWADRGLRELDNQRARLDPAYRRGVEDALRSLRDGDRLDLHMRLTRPENRARPRGRRVVMDLDGTLLDVVRPVLAAVNRERRAAFIEADIRGYDMRPVFDGGEGENSLCEFFKLHPRIWQEAKPYPGAREFVRATLELTRRIGVPFLFYSALSVAEEFALKYDLVGDEFGEDLASAFKGGFGKAELFAPGDVVVDDRAANLEAAEKAGGYPVCVARNWNDPAGYTGFAGRRYDYGGALGRIEELLKG